MADESKNQSAIQAQAQIIPAGIPRRHVPRSKATYRARVVFLIVGVLIATASWICLGVAINEHAGKLPQSIIQPDTAYVVAVVPSCASAVWSLLEILTLMVRMSSRQGVNPIAHLLIDFGLAGSNICAGVLLMPGAVQYDIGDHRAADFIAAWGGMSGMLYLLGGYHLVLWIAAIFETRRWARSIPRTIPIAPGTGSIGDTTSQPNAQPPQIQQQQYIYVVPGEDGSQRFFTEIIPPQGSMPRFISANTATNIRQPVELSGSAVISELQVLSRPVELMEPSREGSSS